VMTCKPPALHGYCPVKLVLLILRHVLNVRFDQRHASDWAWLIPSMRQLRFAPVGDNLIKIVDTF